MRRHPYLIPISIGVITLGRSEYADIRGFFDKLAGAEDAPIVFVKQ